MGASTWKRRLMAAGTVLAVSGVLPLTAGATPAFAAAFLQIEKSHTDSFVRGGMAIYTLTVTNGSQDTSTGLVTVTDVMPEGLTLAGASAELGWDCTQSSLEQLVCTTSMSLSMETPQVFDVSVNIAADAPCNLTNSASVSGGGSPADSDSDPTVVTGGSCNGGNGGDGGGGDGGGGSLLGVNLNGVLPIYNNISTQNNVLSPGASNRSRQNLELNAP
ncbi:DUF11 domain-containing protein [Streptomyces sp. C]|uniref:DUF11 domain-containing protein n=1 Tax=Streptomyces sp. C TaxID=253839 RepID=UPI0013ECFD75|nr:DUF11 domain-containing protein [Streptomyces sp. C]